MGAVCKNCGKEIDGNSPICMYCGVAISDSDMTLETKERMEKEDKQKSSDVGASVKAVGAMLIIIGLLADVVSMFLVFSSSFEAFNILTIIGTISFLLGLAIVSNS